MGMKARRVLLVVLAVVVLLPVLAVGALVLVAQSEWGERFVERRVAAMLHREVEIEGISVKPGWPPRVILSKLRIGNPSWAKTPNLIDAEGFYARVLVLPLFRGRVVVPYLGARHATAGLELDGQRATWRFSERAEQQQDSRLRLGLVYLDDGKIKFIDANEHTDLDIDVKGSAGEGGELQAKGSGTFRGEATTASVRVPSLNPQHTAPLEVNGSAKVGRTEAEARGTLATDGSTLDLQMKLGGQNLKDFSKVSGIVLPDTPPYTFSGHLRHEGEQWNFEPFTGKVGDSDVAGSASYIKGAARPLFKANLRSNLLDVDDLAPIIGAPPKTGAGQTAAPEQREQAAEREASQRLLPEKEFSTEKWGKMDADVRLEAKRVKRPKVLPLDGLKTHLVLKGSVLTLQPLEFTLAGGRITSQVKLDSNQKPMRGDITTEVQGLHLAPLFPAAKSMQEALGTLYGRAELVGHGYSVADLLGTSDGKMSLAVEGGRVSKLLVELIELDVAGLVMLLGPRHEQVELRCAVSGFEVKGGVARSDDFVVDTETTLIKVEGGVNLAQETLDLEAHPYAKEATPVSLRTPLTMKGPMRHPKVRPKPGPLAARGAAAAVLGAINPALSALALIDPGKGKDAPCGQLLAEAKQKGAVKKAG
jgi:uncharacterized protein involved in outer membrane biogenesis